MNKQTDKTKTGFEYFSRSEFLMSRFVASLVVKLYPILKDWEKLPKIKVGGYPDPSLAMHITVFMAALQKLQEIAFTEDLGFDEEEQFWAFYYGHPGGEGEENDVETK